MNNHIPRLLLLNRTYQVILHFLNKFCDFHVVKIFNPRDDKCNLLRLNRRCDPILCSSTLQENKKITIKYFSRKEEFEHLATYSARHNSCFDKEPDLSPSNSSFHQVSEQLLTISSQNLCGTPEVTLSAIPAFQVYLLEAPHWKLIPLCINLPTTTY